MSHLTKTISHPQHSKPFHVSAIKRNEKGEYISNRKKAKSLNISWKKEKNESVNSKSPARIWTLSHRKLNEISFRRPTRVVSVAGRNNRSTSSPRYHSKSSAWTVPCFPCGEVHRLEGSFRGETVRRTAGKVFRRMNGALSRRPRNKPANSITLAAQVSRASVDGVNLCGTASNRVKASGGRLFAAR